ncbi:hypothetical protein [Rhodocaloribacter sp.]
MEKPRTKAEVEALLAQKDASIARRLDTLKSEVGSAGDKLKKVIRHPLLATGATLAGGLAVGWLLGGKRGRKAKGRGESTLTRDFYEVVAKDAERLMRRGLTPREAVREALRRRAPFVLDGGADEPPGLFRSLLSTAGRMFVTVALRNAIETAVMKFMGEDAGSEAQ